MKIEPKIKTYSMELLDGVLEKHDRVFSDCVLTKGEISNALTYGIKQGFVDVIWSNSCCLTWKISNNIVEGVMYV